MRAVYWILATGYLGVLSGFSQDTNLVRSLSLDEAIALAIENNLDLQIERYNPEIARFDLAGSYGGYDPELQVSAIQRFNSSEGGFEPNISFQRPPTETWVETFGASIVGVTPWGLSYDLGGDMVRSSGTFGAVSTNGQGFVVRNRPFQYSSDPGITLRQPLLRNFWIDANRQQILISKKLVQISEYALLQQLMAVVTQVEEAYYDLIFARENVKVQGKAQQLAERLLLENRQRVKVGTMAPLDEKQAESQFAGSEADLLIAEQTALQQQNLLKSLITQDFASWAPVTIVPAESLLALPQALDITNSWARGLTQRPELLQLKQELERMNIVLKFYHNQLFPALDLVGSYGRNALDRTLGGALSDIREGENPYYSYGVVLSIPLSNRAERNRYKAAKAQKQQFILRYKQLEQFIMVELDNAVSLAQTQLERVEATRQARLYSEAALDAEQKKLEAGKSTSFVVLQLQRDLTQARSAEIRALADYNKAIAQIALREGSTLERNRLSFETTSRRAPGASGSSSPATAPPP